MRDSLTALTDTEKEPQCLERDWFDFTYLDKLFVIDLFDSKDKFYQVLGLDREKTKLVRVVVRDNDGFVYGYLNGKLYTDQTTGKKIFESHSIQNKGISDGATGIAKKEGHVPNLMREVVVKLVNSAGVDKMVTSSGLSSGGKVVYERVFADERIGAERRYLEGDDKKEHPYYVFSKIDAQA